VQEHPNVTKMKILGCKLVAVTQGGATLKVHKSFMIIKI
jgi:tryptophan synthase beta chain